MPSHAENEVESKQEKLVLTALSIFFFAAALFKTHARMFWFDELFTIYVSSLPSLSALLSALRDGVDLNPPGLYLLTRVSRAVFGPGEIAVRLPSVFGAWVFTLSMYAFVRRRLHWESALPAILILLSTFVWGLALEARPYALMLAACGVSLLFGSVRVKNADASRALLDSR